MSATAKSRTRKVGDVIAACKAQPFETVWQRSTERSKGREEGRSEGLHTTNYYLLLGLGAMQYLVKVEGGLKVLAKDRGEHGSYSRDTRCSTNNLNLAVKKRGSRIIREREGERERKRKRERDSKMGLT